MRLGGNHPPGFKSPILRSSQARAPNLGGRALTHWTAQGCNSGCSCAHTWPHSASLIRSLASFIWSVATWV